jgi:hypothetical protein
LGIGYANDMMKGYVAIPVRVSRPENAGYIGISKAKLPKSFTLVTWTFPRRLFMRRFSLGGIWQSIFEAVAEPAEPPERMALDSMHIQAHRCAGGGKGGRRNRRLASPRAGATARFTALSISCAARGS